ncbi:MAG: triose-phosphate isomerase [Aeromicrobium sp.]
MLPIIGTSTKMNLTSIQAAQYFQALRPLVQDVTDCQLFVLPPFTSIWVAREELAGSNVAWGAQDVHPAEAGAHTGDVSAAMLADLGCTYVEVGHSERRRDHSETDALIGAKVRAILAHGMVPILCVGESQEGPVEATRDFVAAQLRGALNDIDDADRGRVIVAYEPVWAIGVGARPAAPNHVASMHAAIHDWRRLPESGSVDGPVIYGGSVDPATAGPLLSADGVDGLFVGRAALDPVQFTAIARAGQKQRRL